MTMQAQVTTIDNAVIVGNNPFSASIVADWIKFCDVQPCTQRTYDKAVKSFVGYLLSNGIAQPSRDDVIGYRDSLKSNYKVSTARLYMTVVKKFFRWLSSKGLYLNVADGVKLPELANDEHAHDALTHFFFHGKIRKGTSRQMHYELDD